MEEHIFWSSVWAAGAASGMVRAARRSEYRRWHDLVTVGLYSGMVSFGVIAFWTGGDSSHVGSEYRYLGFSALLGLSGVEHEKIIRAIIQRTAATVFAASSRNDADGADSSGADKPNRNGSGDSGEKPNEHRAERDQQ